MGRPRKVKTVTVEEMEPMASEVHEESMPEFALEENIEDLEKLNSILKSIEGSPEVKIKVSRMTPKGPEYCFVADAVDEDFIQTNYGGGEYQLRIFLNDEYKKTVKLRIANRSNGNPYPNPYMQVPQMTQVTDNSSALKLQVELLQGLVTQMMTQGSKTPVSELAEAMEKLQRLQPSTSSASDKMFEAMMKGFEMAERMGGGQTDWKSEIFKVVRDVAPALVGGYMAATKQPEQPPKHVQQIPSTEEQQTEMIRNAIKELKPRCLQGLDPGLVVDWVMSNLNEQQNQFFVRLALGTDFAVFTTIDPEIAQEPFLSWFKRIYDGLRSAYNEDGEVVEDSNGSTGDKRDTPNNVQTLAGRSKSSIS